ncbi:BQ5605_C003g02115 [Microbotryum silenes-dioicae]|uniref:BQ5605_C003g02115 protein n=1 Tax=Microbotryum silenes-dioicae TaxID=796604 RepID=A0A2X0M0V6_9BASI|nr:BQ5605_C003g02115 [Microbotryum silenes-dioicae]
MRLLISDVEYKLTLVPKGHPDWQRATAPTLETRIPFVDETGAALDPGRLRHHTNDGIRPTSSMGIPSASSLAPPTPALNTRLVQPDEGSVHAMTTLVYRKTLDPVAVYYKIGKKTCVFLPVILRAQTQLVIGGAEEYPRWLQLGDLQPGAPLEQAVAALGKAQGEGRARRSLRSGNSAQNVDVEMAHTSDLGPSHTLDPRALPFLAPSHSSTSIDPGPSQPLLQHAQPTPSRSSAADDHRVRRPIDNDSDAIELASDDDAMGGNGNGKPKGKGKENERMDAEGKGKAKAAPPPTKRQRGG